MSTKIKTSTGKTVTLLNPSEKGAKFAKELKTGVARTNDGRYKIDSNSKKAIRLTNEQRAFRSGYLSAQSDSAKAYNAVHKKGKRK